MVGGQRLEGGGRRAGLAVAFDGAGAEAIGGGLGLGRGLGVGPFIRQVGQVGAGQFATPVAAVPLPGRDALGQALAPVLVLQRCLGRGPVGEGAALQVGRQPA